MVLCLRIFPLHRKLEFYTLSEYLAATIRLPVLLQAAAITALIIMAIIQMVPALYVGAEAVAS